MVVIMIMAVVVVIVVAAAGMVVRMLMSMRMVFMPVVVPMLIVLMGMVLMGMVMPVVIMIVMIVAVMMIVAAVVFVGAALRPEGAGHGRQAAALPAHHLGDDVVVLDIDRLRRDLRRRMAIAEMPCDLEQPQRILGPDFQKLLLGCLDGHEPTVFELQGVPVIEDGRLLEIDENLEAPVGGQGHATALAAFMIEGERVDDALGLDGGLANNGCSARHGLFSKIIGSPAEPG
jgi:hypothetical protein